MGLDEEFQAALRAWQESQTPENFWKLLVLAMRLGMDLPALIEKIGLSGLTNMAKLLRALGVPEEYIGPLEEAIRQYNLNVERARWSRQAAKELAEAINKIKEILGRARGITFDLLKRLGLLEVSLYGVAEAAGVLASGPLALLGGLLLAVPKDATLGWDWSGWWRDPCAELLQEINDAYAEESTLHNTFGASPSRHNAMEGLTQVGHLLALCARYRRECAGKDPTDLVSLVQQILEQHRDEYLAYLATH